MSPYADQLPPRGGMIFILACFAIIVVVGVFGLLGAMMG